MEIILQLMVLRFSLCECNMHVHFTWKVTHSRRLWNIILASRLQVYERCSNLPPNVCYVLCQTLQINFQRAQHCIVVSTALFLPDKFLFSFAAYVRRYIAWAMKVDVIMLTDFLTVENNRGINMYYSYQICYCWHSHLGEKKQMTNSVNNREFLNKDEVRERRGLREGIARAGSIRRVLASIQCQWQW